MKTINYTGNSKLISRIVHLLNRKAPLPLDGDGDADWGTNGQVLTTDGNGNTSWTTPQGGGGDVTDVEVNGTSVVNAQGVAEVSVPTATSDLNNDSGFITNLVNDLANYYTKSQTYTQAEVDALISGIVTLNILVVQTLPTQDISTTTIYLVPKQDTGTSDIYDEYLYINNAWELIGTTQIDLSNYVTTTDLSTALADYVTSVGLATILAGYAQLSDIPTVNDGTLTIQQNGTTVGTFTANQSGNTTVNLTGGGSTYTEGDGIDISSQNAISVDTTFTEASTRANIASGDMFSTILGKIKKFFTDLKTVAFTGSYNDLSNKPTIPDVSTLLPKVQSYAQRVIEAYADASHQWFRIAVLTVTSNYKNHPITFEVSSRGRARHSNICVMFASGDTLDPGLSSFTSDFDPNWYMKRTATSTWELYVDTGSGWNSAYVWRCFGNTVNNGVNVVFSIQALSSAPTGTTQVTYGGNVAYATSAGSVKNYGNRSLTVTDNDGSTVVGFLGTANQIIDLRNKLDKSGGTMTGQIILATNGFRTNSTAGYALDQWGNFVHASTGSSNYFSIRSNSATDKFKVFFETGAVQILGTLTVSDDLTMSGTKGVLFGDAYTVLYRNSDAWLVIASRSGSNPGIQYQTTWHDFKNKDGTQWNTISASGLIQQSNSSRRIKENIKDITEDEAKKLLNVRIVSFDYKPGKGFGDGDERKGKFGVIAEEVDETFPYVVNYDLDSMHQPIKSSPSGVNYDRFIPHLIKMVQMQQDEINELKAEIALLKGEKA